ncbi:MAG: 1-hydroxycarotenoid 3,4-desaturase CrtD [Sphingobacteriaceae bacterium]
MAKVIVIGAGIAGIASAIRMAVKGHDVAIYEANAYAGGKLSEFQLGNFRFDAGPSLFTMPQYVDELFALAGKDARYYFNYEKLETVCHYFYEDGTRIKAWADRDKLAQEIASKTKDSASAVRRFLRYSARIYNITHAIFLEKSLHRIQSFLNWGVLRSLLRFPQIDPFRSMDRANADFFKDDKTIRFFNRYATYNGSNPYQAPATLNVIPHLEQHFGAYFPKGGMYAITQSLVKLAEDLGVVFHYHSPVKEIIVADKKVKGIRMNDEEIYADRIVSNMDVWFTYHQLLKNQIPPQQILNQERSSSALIFYWGIQAEFSELDLHNIFFSEDYEKEFDAIWKHKTIDADPTVYINISSKYRPEDAPKENENWFVMINVPANNGQDWDTLIAEARKNILQKLAKNLGRDIESLILCEEILDPRSIEQKTASYQGALYGTSSNNQFAAFLRHANFSSKIKNLYFVGGSVHPGGGIPLALLSAKIVDDLSA